MATFDYVGGDQKAMAADLQRLNVMIQGVVKTYEALTGVVKVDGQPGAETAKQILAKVQAPLQELLATIAE